MIASFTRQLSNPCVCSFGAVQSRNSTEERFSCSFSLPHPRFKVLYYRLLFCKYLDSSAASFTGVKITQNPCRCLLRALGFPEEQLGRSVRCRSKPQRAIWVQILTDGRTRSGSPSWGPAPCPAPAPPSSHGGAGPPAATASAPPIGGGRCA